MFIKLNTEIEVGNFVSDLHRAELDSYTLDELCAFSNGVRCALVSLGVDVNTLCDVRELFYQMYFKSDTNKMSPKFQHADAQNCIDAELDNPSGAVDYIPGIDFDAVFKSFFDYNPSGSVEYIAVIDFDAVFKSFFNSTGWD
ncbi:MAG: hypothetical protein PUE12_08880 [Oscillospiraceae bacterium]|nr:hypothetical protein [Oscillospiraceae bacterium]